MLPRCQVRLLWSVLTTCLLITYASLALYSRETVRIAHNQRNLLRLHVLANSDSPADQELKLAVRDALIPRLGEIATQGRNAQEVERNVRRAEQALVHTAEEALRALGSDYPARVEIGDHIFPEAFGSNRVLAPGEYRSVRVIIGEGAGKNWWCVLFPPLCLAEEGAGVGVAAVTSQHVNRDGVPVELRWRFLSHFNQHNLTRLATAIRRPLDAMVKSYSAEARARPRQQ